LIIDDSYTNDLSGLKVALHYLSSFRYGKGKIAILSDVALVKNLNPVYEAIAESLVQYGVSRLLTVGKDFRMYFQPPEEVEWISFDDKEGLISYLRKSSPKDQVLLVKGSRRYQLEQVSDVLVESLHPTRLEINLENVLSNLRGFRSKLVHERIKLMAMLKASAYGAGAIELAKLLEFQGVNYFAVAYPEEGVELRKAGVTTPIMVMNTRPEQYALLIEYNLEPEIFSFQSLQSFNAFCKNNDYSCGIHINLDVGMHRLGFLPEDIPNLGVLLKQSMRHLNVKSIYAHMVASGNPQHDEFTKKQILTFKDCSDLLKTQISSQPLLHMVNTEGILRFPEAHFDMVRLGIGLYGIGSDKFLKPAVRLISTISQIKWLDEDQTVGYNRSGSLKRKSRIGIIAMGYADGLSRSLGNGKGAVYIGDQRVPFVGDICMDMSMVDLTDVEGVLEGDEVELFGDSHSIENFAKELRTIPYDVLSSLNRRVQRSFYFD
jgi:alanine racemase